LNAAGFNGWAMKTVETLPDTSTNTVYTNTYGEVMLTVHQNVGDSTDHWEDLQ
jgi:hypothetical protein